MATVTTLQLGLYSYASDTFGAHPSCPTGAVFDLNDGTTFSILDTGGEGGGFHWGTLEPTVFRGGSPRTTGQTVKRRVYINNRMAAVQLVVGKSANYSAFITARQNLESLCNAITEDNPATLKFIASNATTPIYYEVVEAHVGGEYEELLWAQYLDDTVVAVFECHPQPHAGRQILQNLVVNPGFEAPSGPAVQVFTDTFANTNAYTLATSSWRSEVMADGPVRFYRLGESSGTTATDAANSGNNLTYTASPTLGVTGAISGDSNTAVTLNGTTQYATGNATSLPTGASSFSIACWIKVSSSPGSTQTIMSYGLNSTSHGAPQFTIDSSRRIQFSDATTSTAVSAAISTGAYHYLVGTYDGVTLRFYLDGVAGATAAATVAVPGSSTFTVVGATALASPSQFFTGTVDEVVIYNSVLTAARITALYQIGSGTYSLGSLTTDKAYYADTIRADSPTRYYRLDEASGTTAYDAQLTGNNGTYQASPTLSVTGALTGDSDTAITLNGTTQYVSLPTSGLPSASTNWSIECWVKVSGAPGANAYIASWGTFTTKQMVALIMDTSRRIILATFGNDTAPSSALSTGTWHHLVGTWDGTTMRLYIDSVAGPTNAGGALSVTLTNARIGADPAASAAEFFPGSVDEVAIYSSTLSPTQITNHYTVGTSTPSSASNTMLIPAEGQVSFGSATWGPYNPWQVRFRYSSSLIAYFYLHYTDLSNYIACQISGTSIKLVQAASGVTYSLASTSITLVNGIEYWIKLTSTPQLNNLTDWASLPYVSAQLLVDSGAGVAGTQVASINSAAASSSVVDVGIIGKPAIAAEYVAMGIGGNFSNVHSVSLLGPGNWWYQSALANIGSGAWTLTGFSSQSGLSTTTGYQSGPTASYYSGSITLSPNNGLTENYWYNYNPTSTSTVIATAYSTAPSTQFGVLAQVNAPTAGGTGYAKLAFYEYDSSGIFLRNSVVQSISGTISSWQTLSGTVTTGANTAYCGFVVLAGDLSNSSLGAVYYFDNCKMWDITNTGMSTMAYHELRFPMAPAQLMVSGIAGNVACPAVFAIGIKQSSLTQFSTMNAYLGRRQFFNPYARLIGLPYVNSSSTTATIDSTAYGGFYVTTGETDLYNITGETMGSYHPLFRYKNNSSLSVTVTQQQGNYNANAPISLTTYTLYNASLNSSNVWTNLDGGQGFSPISGLSSLASLTAQYASWFGNGAGATSINYLALLPVDGDVFVLAFKNGGSTITTWLWFYWDGTQGTATYNLNTAQTASPSTAQGAFGLLSANITAVNSLADSLPTLIPNLTTASANQFLLHAQDNNATLLPVAVDVYYWPTYNIPV